jgi:hypothetical protein
MVEVLRWRSPQPSSRAGRWFRIAAPCRRNPFSVQPATSAPPSDTRLMMDCIAPGGIAADLSAEGVE